MEKQKIFIEHRIESEGDLKESKHYALIEVTQLNTAKELQLLNTIIVIGCEIPTELEKERYATEMANKHYNGTTLEKVKGEYMMGIRDCFDWFKSKLGIK